MIMITTLRLLFFFQQQLFQFQVQSIFEFVET